MITGQKLDTRTLVDEMPEKFPLTILCMIQDIQVIAFYDYSLDFFMDDESPINLYYDGLMECFNTKSRKKIFTQWCLSIKILENDETHISVIGFTKTNMVRFLKSGTYSTKEVFKDCKSIQRRNKLELIMDGIGRKRNSPEN